MGGKLTSAWALNVLCRANGVSAPAPPYSEKRTSGTYL